MIITVTIDIEEINEKLESLKDEMDADDFNDDNMLIDNLTELFVHDIAEDLNGALNDAVFEEVESQILQISYIRNLREKQ